MPAKFVLKKGRTGKFSFTMEGPTGQSLMTSVDYATKRAAMAGIAAVMKNAAGGDLIDSTAVAKKVPAKKATKTAASKKAVSKKAAPKKAASKTAPAKKSAAKSAPARKTATKGIAAKKTATKKTATTKAAAKNAGATKAGAKKATKRTTRKAAS